MLGASTFLAMIILAVLAAIGVFGYVIYYYVICGVLAPTRRAMASVALKRRTDGNLPDFFITFDFLGRQQQFSVPYDVFTELDVGDAGLLVYKGNLFRGFKPTSGGWEQQGRTSIRPV